MNDTLYNHCSYCDVVKESSKVFFPCKLVQAGFLLLATKKQTNKTNEKLPTDLSLFSKLIEKSFHSIAPKADRSHMLDFFSRYLLLHLLLGLPLFHRIDTLCSSKPTQPLCPDLGPIYSTPYQRSGEFTDLIRRLWDQAYRRKEPG